ncbi:MAG: FKBP-type peptidyl-prolyl cis-trans isomerase [Bacteroidales bacterium]|nr:FKBP-type peptidyl-prolyl cis-trans isomerase [Bacteroidales bacterium]
MNDFLKGFYEGVSVSDDDVKRNAYIAGLQIGKQFGGQTLEQFSQQIFGESAEERLSQDNFIAGFTAGATKNEDIMSTDEAGDYIETTIASIELRMKEKEFGFNRDAGYAFLEENKTKEGVVALPSGLQYKVITTGKGAIPALTDRVKVHYRGTLIDGTEFDSSYKNGQPASFTLMGVIAGWTEALAMMPVGSKWMLYIPQELAYGDQSKGQLITPFSALVFEVELLEIEKQPTDPNKQPIRL